PVSAGPSYSQGGTLTTAPDTAAQRDALQHSNKSSDPNLADTTGELYPTEQAVKTYVDTQIAASNQTIVSADPANSITIDPVDGGALYDDADNLDDVADNAADILTKKDTSNKS